MKTRFTDLVGCELPIQLAAMGGGVGTTELAAAVVTAGAFGMVSWITEPAPGACGMNYLMPFAPSPDAVQEAAKKVRVVEFSMASRPPIWSGRPMPGRARRLAGGFGSGGGGRG